jgi:hypothetical protein
MAQEGLAIVDRDLEPTHMQQQSLLCHDRHSIALSSVPVKVHPAVVAIGRNIFRIQSD